MADKLKERAEKNPSNELPQEPELPLIPKAILSISSSLDTLAWIAEKWAVKNGLVTEEELKDG